MSVSYASAASSASNHESKEQKAEPILVATTVSSTVSSLLSSTESSAPSNLVSTSVMTISSDPVSGPVPIASSNQDTDKEPLKSTTTSSTSIDKFKSGLTPAPVPTTNPWATTARQSPSSFAVETEPKVPQKVSQSNKTLDTVNWPKPDEGSPYLTEGSTSAPPTIKSRPGKEKWIPISYTPVSSKPRGNKSRGGKINNGNNNKSVSPSSNGQATNGNHARRGSKAQGSRPGFQMKKADGKSPAKGRSSSVSNIKSDGSKKFASEPTGPRTAPVVSSKEEPDKKASSTKDEPGTSSETNSSNGHHSKHYYSNPHNFNNRNAKGHSGKFYNRRPSHFNNGNFNGMYYYRNDYDNFSVYPPVGPIELFRPIISQIEYYFSPANLCKDTYLRGLMNSNGWVPLNLLSSFYRVSRLTNGDYNLFVEACKWAPSVEVVGDKIRLRLNWENWVFPYAERLEAGKNEDPPIPVNLVFNPARAAPFIPRTESKGNGGTSESAEASS